MISTKLIDSVFFIKVGNSTGSSFTVCKNGIQYLISARHIFENYKNNSCIKLEIFHNKEWVTIEGELLFHEKEKIDICVIKLSKHICEDFAIEKAEEIAFGQDLFMLGFPYGLYTEFTKSLSKFPFPFLKKGCLSGAITNDEHGTMYFLDGHNNKGFSGGLVCYMNPKTNKPLMVSVISGYIPQEGQIKTPYGDWKYNENSGIVITYSIKHAFEIIENN